MSVSVFRIGCLTTICHLFAFIETPQIRLREAASAVEARILIVMPRGMQLMSSEDPDKNTRPGTRDPVRHQSFHSAATSRVNTSNSSFETLDKETTCDSLNHSAPWRFSQSRQRTSSFSGTSSVFGVFTQSTISCSFVEIPFSTFSVYGN